jgi:hypothetical protein
MAMKYPSRKTIARMCRSEVEDRIEKWGIELPARNTKQPVWWDDCYDPIFKVEGTTEAEFLHSQAERREAWLHSQETDEEHPAAREMLFQEGLRRAVERAGLQDLNTILLRLKDKETVPAGCEYWSHWTYRIATRMQREQAVVKVLSAEDKA